MRKTGQQNGQASFSLSRWLVLVVAFGVFSFASGIYVGKTDLFAFADMSLPLLVSEDSDTAWAQQRDLLSPGTEMGQPLTQAVFLQMVVKVLGVTKPAGPVPKGAEHHLAKETYAVAKANGIIDCSCQVKPDSTLTRREAAKHLMLGINYQVDKPLVSLEQVERWAKGRLEQPVADGTASDRSGKLTYAEAVQMLRQAAALHQSSIQ